MRRQRGTALWVYGLIVLGIIAGLYGLYALIDANWVTSAGRKAGEASKQAQWDAANREAEDNERARRRLISTALSNLQADKAAAELRAQENEAKWKEADRERQRQGRSLAVCGPATPTRNDGGIAGALGSGQAGVFGGGAGDRAAAGVRFTWDFVFLYDSAWTGTGGQPLYGAEAGRLAQTSGAGAASPYGPDDVKDVHRENASRSDACRRDLNALMDRVEAAEAAFDKRRTQ